MFAKNKVTQSMLDAVNSVLEESNIDEASLKIPTATGTIVHGGHKGYGSKEAYLDQHKNPFEKGPSKKDLKGVKAPTKKELKSIGESESSEEDKEQDAKAEKATGMTHAEYEKSARDKKEDKKKSMKKESAFTSKLLTIFKENKASGAQETFTDNNMGEGKGLIGKQKKLDKNHNGKLDAQDFEILRKMRKEEIEELTEEQLDEMINEVLSKDASAGDYIRDFLDSDDPKFDGKSKAKRKEMALAAYYKAQNEEVDLEESDTQYKNNLGNLKAGGDAINRGETVKDLMKGRKYFGSGKVTLPSNSKVKELDEIEENDGTFTDKQLKMASGIPNDKRYRGGNWTAAARVMDKIKPGLSQHPVAQAALRAANEAVETSPDKNAEKITTDTLAGRVAGGKLNSFRNFKTNLTTNGTQSIPSEIEHGEDTKEKQKITTNPGPVDIKLDDKLTGPTPYTHFQKKEKITTEEVRGELKKIRNKEGKEHDKEIEKFTKKTQKTHTAEDELDENAKWRNGPALLRHRAQSSTGPDRNVAKHPDETRTWVPSDSMYGGGEKIPVQRKGRNNPDPLEGREKLKPGPGTGRKTTRALKSAIETSTHKKSNLPEEVETINEDGWLDKYLLSKGINPKFVSQATKISHAKSGAFMAWKQSHQNESVEPCATETPSNHVKVTAKTALERIKKHLGSNKK